MVKRLCSRPFFSFAAANFMMALVMRLPLASHHIMGNSSLHFIRTLAPFHVSVAIGTQLKRMAIELDSGLGDNAPF